MQYKIFKKSKNVTFQYAVEYLFKNLTPQTNVNEGRNYSSLNMNECHNKKTINVITQLYLII